MTNPVIGYIVIIAMFLLVATIVGLEMVGSRQRKEIKGLRKELADLSRELRNTGGLDD